MGQEENKSKKKSSRNGVSRRSAVRGLAFAQADSSDKMSSTETTIAAAHQQARSSNTHDGYDCHNEGYVLQDLEGHEEEEASEMLVVASGKSQQLDSSYARFRRNDRSRSRQHTSASLDEASEMDKLQLPPCLRAASMIDAVDGAPLKPPVTTETLKELDLHYIQNNLNLRVDVHFDHDLHFMPISGRRGEEKRDESRKYWLSLEAELRVYEHMSSTICDACAQHIDEEIVVFPRRLPAMFKELQELLLILVPDKDHDSVMTTLDVDFIMQQLRHGVLDIAKLARWLNKLLTSHCAPVRDEWAEEIAQTLTEGARRSSSRVLVEGLEKLFSFCEAMKLDVANHQIRTFRTPLIEDGVSFQRDYFTARIQTDKINVQPAHQWFRDTAYRMASKQQELPSGISVLVCGLVELSVSPTTVLPLTFRHDAIRIQRVQEEIQDLIHLQVCCSVLNELATRLLGRPVDLSPLHAVLKSRVLDLVNTDTFPDTGPHGFWQYHSDSIAIEITRAAFDFVEKAGTSTSEVDATKCHFWVKTRLVSDIYQQPFVHDLATKLMALTSHHVSIFNSYSALAISQLQQTYAQQIAHRDQTIPLLEDIARRLAHTAVIHWRVWADLAYIPDPASCAATGDDSLFDASPDL